MRQTSCHGVGSGKPALCAVICSCIAATASQPVIDSVKHELAKCRQHGYLRDLLF
jgi:hypothetical protein